MGTPKSATPDILKGHARRADPQGAQRGPAHGYTIAPGSRPRAATRSRSAKAPSIPRCTGSRSAAGSTPLGRLGKQPPGQVLHADAARAARSCAPRPRAGSATRRRCLRPGRAGPAHRVRLMRRRFRRRPASAERPEVERELALPSRDADPRARWRRAKRRTRRAAARSSDSATTRARARECVDIDERRRRRMDRAEFLTEL